MKVILTVVTRYIHLDVKFSPHQTFVFLASKLLCHTFGMQVPLVHPQACLGFGGEVPVMQTSVPAAPSVPPAFLLIRHALSLQTSPLL